MRDFYPVSIHVNVSKVLPFFFFLSSFPPLILLLMPELNAFLTAWATFFLHVIVFTEICRQYQVFVNLDWQKYRLISKLEILVQMGCT